MTDIDPRTRLAAIRANAEFVAEHEDGASDIQTRLAQCILELVRVLEPLVADRLAPVVDIHTRTVPEPRFLPGESVGDYWQRTGMAWPGKNVVPLAPEEER